jgi:hypothetical protein
MTKEFGSWQGTEKDFFSSHHYIQTGSGDHPAFHPMGTGGSIPRYKAVRA